MMKKTWKTLLIALVLTVFAFCAANAEGVITVNPDLEPMTQAETLEMFAEAADAYYQDPALIEELKGEITIEETEVPVDMVEDGILRFGSLTHNGQTMRFLIDQIGEPDEAGRYPLYLTLHGGGEDEPEGNDSQWFEMYDYYREAVTSGIYIACRGITNTWDLHFRPESYPLYDRLIQAMVCLYHADPNRVYVLGFSAGGDGVYQIAARMPERFAAANMSSGHPNGVSLLNLANCPFSIQVGVRDYYSESAMRCIRAAEFDQVLKDYHDLYEANYLHQVLGHVPAGHNYNDYSSLKFFEDDEVEGVNAEVIADPAAYADPAIVEDMLDDFMEAFEKTTGEYTVSRLSYYGTEEVEAFDDAIRKIIKEKYGLETVFVNASAVDYVSKFVRNPAPDTVVWDLGTRAEKREVTSFYWLKADASVTSGTIVAKHTGDNTILIKPENVNGDFSILVNPALLDVSLPIRIVTPEGEFDVQVNPSLETLRASILETGDPNLAWVAEIPYSMLHD